MLAVLFDLDGTLVDTVKDIQASLNHMMKMRQLKRLSTEETKAVVGHGLKNALKSAYALSSVTLSEDVFEGAYQEMIHYYADHVVVDSTLYDGVLPFLERCQKEGIRIGVLSNKRDELVKRILKILLPTISFDFVQGSIEGKPLKPSKEAVEAFCEVVGVPSKDVLLVGDSEVDYLTQQNAQTKGAFVTYGFRTKEQLTKEGVEPLFDSMTQIGEMLWN